MGGTALAEIDPRLRRQFEKAQAALARGDLRYAIAVTRSLLTHEPWCLEIRLVLRQAQEQAVPPGRGSSILRSVRHMWLRLRSGLLLRNPLRGMRVAEDWLSRNPREKEAHRLLALCALAGGDHLTACFAFRAWRESDPRDPAPHVALTQSLLAIGNAEEALTTAEYMLERFPDHPPARQLVKEAGCALTLEKGRWLEEGDFRGKLAGAPVPLPSRSPTPGI